MSPRTTPNAALEHELNAQRDDLRAILRSTLPSEQLQALKFPLPEVQAFDVHNVDISARWAYFGVTMMPQDEPTFRQLAASGEFSARLAEAIEAEEELVENTGEDTSRLERYRDLLKRLEGAGNQKRLDIYAQFLDYKNFPEYREILDRINEACKEAGTFSLTAMLRPATYFELRLRDSSELQHMFAADIECAKKVFSRLPSWWLDAAIACRQAAKPGVWIQPYKDWLMLFTRRDEHSIVVEAIGAITSIVGPRPLHEVVPAPNWSVELPLLAVIAGERIGNGGLSAQQGGL